MKKKKNKFLTFVFSLLPGAGHMYMGFMKSGISFMGIFFLIIFLSSWLSIGPLLYFLPLVWFYSFFDCLNKSEATEDEFSLLEDDYLFSADKLAKVNKGIFQKRKLFAGILILVLGIYLILNNVMTVLQECIPPEIYNTINNCARIVPKIIIGIGIIVLGIWLIFHKKKECDTNA